MIYVMEVTDEEAATEAARSSIHRIDADHKRVVEYVVGEDVRYELLLDLHR